MRRLPGWDVPADASALRPSGAAAASIYQLFSGFFWTCLVVFALVLAAALWAVARRRGDTGPLKAGSELGTLAAPAVGNGRGTVALEPSTEKRLLGVTAAATALTVVTLLALLVASARTGHALGSADQAPLVVKVRAQQWWWRIEYPGKVPAENVVTANELHVPTGRAVKLVLGAADVIHSLWIPELAGKRDLIPGRVTELTLEVQRPGVYRGQCAEFCGAQHAHMAILVVAHPPAEFARWLDRQRAPAAVPHTPLEARGREVFLSSSCPLCHNITGTEASASLAPDLTHFASRRSLAAGTLPNTREHLARWIQDPQGVKPGSYMPSTALAPEALQSLLGYLGALK
jgi:cytochrome c oxidase subunit 2